MKIIILVSPNGPDIPANQQTRYVIQGHITVMLSVVDIPKTQYL